jgi:hypothetical protein
MCDYYSAQKIEEAAEQKRRNMEVRASQEQQRLEAKQRRDDDAALKVSRTQYTCVHTRTSLHRSQHAFSCSSTHMHCTVYFQLEPITATSAIHTRSMHHSPAVLLY